MITITTENGTGKRGVGNRISFSMQKENLKGQNQMKKTRHFIQRMVVVLAAVAMVFQTVPFTAFAEDEAEAETVIGIETEETVEDETYTAVFKCNNFKNAQGFGVYTSSVYNPRVVEAGDIDGKKTLDTENIRIRIGFMNYDIVLFIKMLIVLLIGVALIWLPYGRIQ